VRVWWCNWQRVFCLLQLLRKVGLLLALESLLLPLHGHHLQEVPREDQVAAAFPSFLTCSCV
jgi:hypothetical protein